MFYKRIMGLDYGSLSRGELIRLLEMHDRRNREPVHRPAAAGEAERYRNLMEQAADGIFIADGNGIYLEVNQSGARMLGRSAAEIIGRHIRDFVVPEDIPALEADLATLRAQKVYRRERRLGRKDGSVILVEVSVRKLSDGRIQGILRDITLRQQAGEMLRLSEERFRNLTAAAFEGLCISEHGRILDVNDPFTTMFGYSRDELIGRDILTLIAPPWRDAIAGRIRTGQEAPFVHQSMRKDGSRFDAEAQAKVISWRGRTVRVTALRDVTGRIRTEQALRESEEKYAKAFRNSPDAVTITRLADGRIIETNEGFRRVFGHSLEKAVGRTSLELRLWGNPADRDRALQELHQTGFVRDWELPFRTRDGKMGVGLFSAEKIEIRGEPCLVTVVHDITGRKAAEAERADAVLREQQARAEYTLRLIAAQEAERARIAAELHDSLGQNLLLIKNHAQLALAAKKVPPTSRLPLESISQLASQSIAEARQISHDLHPYQLDHLGLTRALQAMIEGAAASSGIDFAPKLDHVDALFPKDAALNLYRVVQECLNNILKHSRAKHVRLRLERDVHEVQLSVQDDGVGFKTGGPMNGERGLGLRNMAERVRILGGSIKVDSQSGRGTRIQVTIPVAGDA